MPADSISITNNSHETDILLFFFTPLAISAKHGKHNIYPESVSPVTLAKIFDWSRLTRIIFLSIMSVIGSVGNIFMISSMMIEDHLRRAGNSNE